MIFLKNKKNFTPRIFFNRKNRGFTLIEVVVSLFVIIVGIIGVVNVIQQSVAYSQFVSSKLVAAYLAQEGIEIVRNIRDTNWLEEAPTWNDELDNGDYEAVYDDTGLTPYLGRLLKIDTTSGFYNYLSGDVSVFKRKINLNNTADGLEVTVLVEWEEKDKTHEVSVKEKLYDWYK